MTEEDVRQIVREEIFKWQEEIRAARTAWVDQHKAFIRDEFAPNPNDGPLTSQVKAIFRKTSE